MINSSHPFLHSPWNMEWEEKTEGAIARPEYEQDRFHPPPKDPYFFLLIPQFQLELRSLFLTKQSRVYEKREDV